MGLAFRAGAISEFDVTSAAANVAASTTVTLGTVTGEGSATLVVIGDGHAQVDILYSIDGAADVTLGASDIAEMIVLGFAVSLDVKAKNNDGGAGHNHSSVSWTGVKQ